MSHDVRWIAIMLVVIAMGAVMMRDFPTMGFIQIVAGAMSLALHLQRLTRKRS